MLTPWNTDAAELVRELVPTLTIWREASGEGYPGMLAVAWVIRNRTEKRRLTASEVCLQPWQFSSMNAKGDPAMVHYPSLDDSAFLAAYQAWKHALASPVDADPTKGADFYFNPSLVLPPWASAYQKTVAIGHHDFYRS